MIIRKEHNILFPGSFDPITLGHMALIQKLSLLFQEVLIGIGVAESKNYYFSLEKRINMVKESCKSFKNVRVIQYSNLTVELCKEQACSYIARGVRNTKDFEYELNLANVNKELDSNIETLLFPAQSKFSHISSSVVNELIKHEYQDLNKLVPAEIIKLLQN